MNKLILQIAHVLALLSLNPLLRKKLGIGSWEGAESASFPRNHRQNMPHFPGYSSVIGHYPAVPISYSVGVRFGVRSAAHWGELHPTAPSGQYSAFRAFPKMSELLPALRRSPPIEIPCNRTRGFLRGV